MKCEMKYKICSVCKEEKSISFFYSTKSGKNGESYLRSDCKECYSIKKKRWIKENPDSILRYRKHRRLIIELLGNKCNNPFCLVPGGCEDFRCLQIDHINGKGKTHIRNWNGNTYRYYKQIYEEILEGSKDYQILCANCNWISKSRI